MRLVIAAIVGFAGFVVSAYFGLVVMFVGGIEKIVDEINAEVADGGEVAWGVVQIIFASTAFGIGAAISFFLAALIAGWRDQ